MLNVPLLNRLVIFARHQQYIIICSDQKFAPGAQGHPQQLLDAVGCEVALALPAVGHVVLAYLPLLFVPKLVVLFDNCPQERALFALGSLPSCPDAGQNIHEF